MELSRTIKLATKKDFTDYAELCNCELLKDPI